MDATCDVARVGAGRHAGRRRAGVVRCQRGLDPRKRAEDGRWNANTAI